MSLELLPRQRPPGADLVFPGGTGRSGTAFRRDPVPGMTDHGRTSRRSLNCASISARLSFNRPASAASITVTSVNSVGLEGSYDLTFANNDHVTGTFRTGACANYTPPPTGIHTCK